MADTLISCDDHMDLGQLPADLWETRLPAALRLPQRFREGFHEHMFRVVLIAEPRGERLLDLPHSRRPIDGQLLANRKMQPHM